ncbi:MAG: translation initiation factor IF-3 [Chlamydiales bacterium]
MRINGEIRTPTMRVIGADGDQVGIISRREALDLAEKAGLDLVEIVAKSNPPVCKIIDYGKFRYDQTKREKESKKAQVQIKVKEIKVKPNIDTHDFDFKLKHAKQFLEKGNKVKITCSFRGREMAHPEVGRRVVEKMIEALEDFGTVEAPMKRMGRMLTTVLSPCAAPKKLKSEEQPKLSEK